MMHQQIEDQEIIERYVRNQLEPEERKAFEEHFFGCDDCFEKLQATERFVAGIRDAAARGLLPDGASGTVPPRRIAPWWIPAFGLSAVAALLLASVTGWLYFIQMPKMRGQLSQSAADLRAAQEERAALEQQLQRSVQVEANVPLVMLQATRDTQAPPTEATLPAGAPHLVLWIDVGSGRFTAYRLEIYGADGKLLDTLEHLTRNSYGALAASLPAERLQPGNFRIKLSGEEPPPASLLAEYRLRIRRP
ncbi:MAG TPA: zf-HC2 domain-containing protein [Candidatus Acidoferrum sp.]|nr:zf-HC2 domain-containing protein [Candidatus Acidoferrum sp.]